MSQLGQFKRLATFLEPFFPELKLDKSEFNRENAEKVIFCLIDTLDGLLKAENMALKKNLPLTEVGMIFSIEPVRQCESIARFLRTFNSQLFNLSKTERQTLIFIIENVGEYLKGLALPVEEKEKKGLFADFKFWIENFFKIIDQKAVNASVSTKTGKPVYSNAFHTFDLAPFIITTSDGSFFLAGIDQGGGELVYRNPLSEKEIRRSDDLGPVAEFLLANLAFPLLNEISKHTESGPAVLRRWPAVEIAWRYHRQQAFEPSYHALNEAEFEDFNLPLIHLMQIRNLFSLNRIFEVKRQLQKFLLFYPFYAEGHEIMGDVYNQEENHELALNFYEKVMELGPSKSLADKIKRTRESIDKTKGKSEIQRNDAFFDITESVPRHDERIIGRKKELRQMIEILISTSKRNLLLVGDRGVGKSTLIRLLAEKIVFEEVPTALKDKKIKEINFVYLLTGSKYRGQFEEKVLKLLQEFRGQNAILVLEDLHLMMSSGTARGTSLDLVNILKNFLRDNSIQVIATTDYEEYKNTIEKDNSLLGYFQKITVNEMSADNTRKILKNLASGLALKERLLFPNELIEDIVEGAKRDIRERKLPDSAIMLLERCVAKVKLRSSVEPSGSLSVTESDLAEVLADFLNLPETNLSVSLKNRLLALKENILKRIVGQNEAIERMVSSIITAQLGYDVKHNKPDGVFLFIGPTGVGKTETAIALSESLYGSQDYLIRIDMSEYMERFTYSRFVGAAPGYVGYYDANQLTDKVRQNPFSVILLDEIEKADSQLLNIFLQVFDAGRLTDARGNVVDFSNTIVIMTSNIGTALFSKTNMGYQSNPEGNKVTRQTLVKALKKYFSPEFLNRLDEIIVFRHLADADIRNIIQIQLQQLRRDLERQGKELVVKDEVIGHVAAKGYSLEYGARNLSRTLKQELLEKLARQSLEKGWEEARAVICQLGESGIEVVLEPVGSSLVGETVQQKENSK